MTTHEYELDLEPGGDTATVLRIVGVLHARGAAMNRISVESAGPSTTVTVSVVPRPDSAASLARQLARIVDVRSVTGPREVAPAP